MFRKCIVCGTEATWTDEGLQEHTRNCAESFRKDIARLTKERDTATLKFSEVSRALGLQDAKIERLTEVNKVYEEQIAESAAVYAERDRLTEENGKLREAIVSLWKSGHCPICGATPHS